MAPKRKSSAVVREGETVYCKFDLTDDETNKVVPKWYKGVVTKIITQNDKEAECMIEFEDGEIYNFMITYSEKSQIWDNVPPLSYKKQKQIMQDVEIDYDFIVNAVYKRIEANLKKSDDELVKLIDKRINKHLKKIRVEMPLDFIHGDMPDLVRDLFDTVAKEEKLKYQGTSLAGVVNCKGKGKTMCAYYKNLRYPCASKFFDVNTRFYASKDATKVHLSRFGETSLRNTSAELVFDRVKNKALCPSCVNKYCEADSFINFVKRKENCAICKCKRPSTNHEISDDKIPICNECVGANDPTANNEKFYMSGLNLLTKIFARHELRLQRSTCVTAFNNSNRTIDFTINGKIGTSRFVIVIEMDQDQHKGYDPKDERKKTAEECAFMMRENGYDKLLVIRFNPNVGWKENGSDDRVAYYNSKERLLVLRSWIIWYLMNYETVRDCMIMYLWYDCNKKKDLFEPGFDGFGMAYNAPAMPAGANWIYTAEPTEVMCDAFANINNRRVDVDNLFKYWKTETQIERFPKSIQVLMA